MKLNSKIGGWGWGRLKLLSRTGQPVATASRARGIGQKFRMILISLSAKMSQNKGCLSRLIRIHLVSPPASYYPSFRQHLHIQVNVSTTKSTLLCSDMCLMVDQNIYSSWKRGTQWPRCPLFSEWSDDWPRRRLARSCGTLCSRDCLIGAICKHRETNPWLQH